MENKNKLIKNLTYIIFAIILVVFINIGFVSYARAASINELVRLANSSRATDGLANLTMSTKLNSAAFAKAHDMLTNDYFAHTSPAGKTPWDFIKASNYNYTYAGENLAIGYTDDQELHDAWMNSPSHRANIMNPNFREIGLAVMTGEYEGSQTTIVVEMFGAPADINTTNLPQVASAQTQNTPLNLVQDQTKFSPTKIFAQEKVKFQVALTGDIQTMIITVGEQTINLVESSSMSQNEQTKTYTKEVSIDQVGNFPVSLRIVSQSGQTITQNMGTLTVLAKTLAKTDTTTNQKLKDFTSVNFTAIMSGFLLLILGLIIIMVYRNQKQKHLA